MKVLNYAEPSLKTKLRRPSGFDENEERKVVGLARAFAAAPARAAAVAGKFPPTASRRITGAERPPSTRAPVHARGLRSTSSPTSPESNRRLRRFAGASRVRFRASTTSSPTSFARCVDRDLRPAFARHSRIASYFIPSSPLASDRRSRAERRRRVAFAFDSRVASRRAVVVARHMAPRASARPRLARVARGGVVAWLCGVARAANLTQIASRVRRRRRANRRIHHPRGARVVRAVGAVDDRVRPGRANDQRADAHDVAGDADDDRDAGRGRDAVRRAVRVRERAGRASRREIERAWR